MESGASPTPDDAIAVIGLACSLPGAPDVAAFWRLLREGDDAITEPPAGRRDEASLRRGGYLHHVDRFDAALFGIAPPQAAAMDPQQRLMLALAWAAREECGSVA